MPIIPPLLTQIFLAILLAAIVSASAYRAHALTRSGALAAWGIGSVVSGIGGWMAAAALLTFFVSSTVLSRWRRKQKETLGYEKGGRRDAGQVLANGGVAAACILLSAAGVKSGMLLFLAALAAANADTWATEIGSIVGGQPYDIRTGKKVSAGSSGAVSLPGTFAALAGSALLGLFAHGLTAGLIVTASGFGGAFFDSLLGATVQAQWRHPSVPGQWTERPQAGPPERGWRRVGNDFVNGLCTLTGAGLAGLLLKIILLK
ncbi:MAG: DUF92 domain-containing protein [Janthinobacterium lividum]